MIKNCLQLIIALVLLVLSVSHVRAAEIILQPSDRTVYTGRTLFFDLSLNTENVAIVGADTAIRFDPEYLEFLAVPQTNWFNQTYTNIPPNSNTLYVRSVFTASNQNKTSTQFVPIAKITMRAKKAGTTTVSLSCAANNRNDTNVWDESLSDIINCTENTTRRYTITIGAEPTRGATGGQPAVPTPTFPGETPVPGDPTCDLCGACKDKNGVLQKPANWDQCRLCLYNADETKKTGFSWTPVGCVANQQNTFVQKFLGIGVQMGGGIAMLVIMYGAFLMMTSRGDYEKLATGKGLVVKSIGALLILVFAIFLLQFVGLNILGLPSFG